MRNALDGLLPPRILELLASGERIRIAASPVSHAAIRGWCQAIGLIDPCFTRACDGPNARLIAPPPMLQAWAGPGLSSQPVAANCSSTHHDVREVFRAAGFSSVVATNYVQHYYDDLAVGDVVEEHSWIEDVSSRKSTRLGYGHFVRIGFRFHEKSTGRLIGTQSSTTFYYVPMVPVLEARKSPVPAQHLLDPLAIELTPTLVIAGAIASNDFEKVHHDRGTAIADGLPDIILSIITSAGLVLRYLTDHLGQRGSVTSLQLRLGAPACPGDELILTHAATEISTKSRTVEVRGIVSDRLHLEAEVEIISEN